MQTVAARDGRVKRFKYPLGSPFSQAIRQALMLYYISRARQLRPPTQCGHRLVPSGNRPSKPHAGQAMVPGRESPCLQRGHPTQFFVGRVYCYTLSPKACIVPASWHLQILCRASRNVFGAGWRRLAPGVNVVDVDRCCFVVARIVVSQDVSRCWPPVCVVGGLHLSSDVGFCNGGSTSV